MAKSKRTTLAPVEHITNSIHIFRGHKVLLDEDLAALYGVATKVLLQAVKRNPERFAEDFLIQLTASEWTALRSQFVTSKPGRGGRRYAPYAFTEQGVAMLSSVLGSDRAIAAILCAIRQLMNPPQPKRRGIGFTANIGGEKS